MKLTKKEADEAISRLKNEVPIEYSDSYFRSWDIKTVRQPFVFAVWELLKEIYKEYLNEEGRLENIPHEGNEYSMLNYLSTNYKAFPYIVNYINKKIVDTAKQGKLIATHQIEFNEDRTNWVESMEHLIFMMQKFKYEILLPDDNGVFDNIIKKIEETNKRGYLSEKEMGNFIKMLIPLAKNFEFGGHGKKSDMVDGIDIQFTVGNKINTLQQKRCSNVYKGQFHYFVGGVGGIKPYHVTYLGFQTGDDELFIFKNDDSIKVKEYEGKFSKDGKKYQIPIKNFVASKKLKNKK